MLRVFFAEWRKLRRPTLFLGTYGAALGLTALISSLLYLRIDSASGNGDRGRIITPEQLSGEDGSIVSFEFVGSGISFLGLLPTIAFCVFAAQTSQEYTYGTLRNLLVRQPRRITLLVGKIAAMKVFVLLLTLTSAIVSILISYFLSDRAGVSTDLWFTSDGRTAIYESLLNVFISVVYFALVGIVLGLLLRSPISSISIGILWLLIIEGLIGAVKPVTLEWMPGYQLSTIAEGGNFTVTYSHALTLGSIYVAVALLISGVLFARRDVAN
jgi:ABC-type transport system involved in multi-copper enzyme maturation permease subunit